MNPDDEVINCDSNASRYPEEGKRHSPPALDEGQHYFPEKKNRPADTLVIPEEGSEDYTRYMQIRASFHKTETISTLSYHIQKDVKEALNIPMDSGDDWRGVASRLGVKAITIKKIEAECDPDPTEKILCETQNKKIRELLEVLYKMKRFDVLNIFYDHLQSNNSETEARQKESSSSKFPCQETPTSSSAGSAFTYSPSQLHSPKDLTPESSEPRNDSGMDSSRSRPISSGSKPGCVAKQNTDEDLAKRFGTAINFHHPESTDFWREIPPKPNSTTKKWNAIEAALKRVFPKESSQSQVMRLICHTLKVEPYEERHIKDVHWCDFANLVAWFGPVKSGKDGLFGKITQLIKDSVINKTNSGPHSFFAGHMTKEKADSLIGSMEVGTFLIRFSSSDAENGSFVVCLQTQNGPEHVLLEGNPTRGKIIYGDKEYDDLITLYQQALRNGGVSQDKRVSCTTVCPNLPLNVMFKPYGSGSRPSQP